MPPLSPVSISSTGASETRKWTSSCEPLTGTALEVKTARGAIDAPGLAAFAGAWKPVRTVLIGEGGVAIEKFLTTPAERWLER